MNADHAWAMAESGQRLPPILVHRETMRVIDGMHRLRAAALRGQETVEVRFFDGDEGSTFVLAVQSNVKHGLPLTLADRVTAATRIVHSHPEWSDRRIAGIAGLSPKTIGAIRRRSNEEIPQSDTRVGSDGRTRHIKTRQRSLPERAPTPDGAEVAVPQQMARQRPLPSAPPASMVELELLAAVRELRHDPSLRLSGTGRLLLRLLDLHSLDQRNWDQLSVNVPPHCARRIAELARECGRRWQTFAERVDRGSGD